jgi:hypothetical protein
VVSDDAVILSGAPAFFPSRFFCGSAGAESKDLRFPSGAKVIAVNRRSLDKPVKQVLRVPSAEAKNH